MDEAPNPRKPQSRPPDSAGDEEEVAHLDDAIIGRAFRWSGLALVFLIGAGIVVALILRRPPPPPPEQVTPMTAPVRPDYREVKIPEVRFGDITREAGIQFVHNNGATGEKLLPETMGAGAAFFDYDGDGDPDLLFVNATHWPGKDGSKPAHGALYQNDGNGVFTDVTAGSGLDVSFYGMGVATGDYDNDGHVDVFLTAVGPNRLFRNRGDGTFEDVTGAAGVAGDAREWSTTAAFLDYDNDGDLDLFVANYVRWSREIDFEVDYRLVGIGRAYGPPMNFPGTFPYLYRNDGKGAFTDVSAESGIQMASPALSVPMAKSLGLAPVDLDQDGWIDVIVANDTVPNFVFHNQRNGKFVEIGARSGIAFDNYGQTRGAMGIDTGCFRNDGCLGVGIANFANEMTALYVARPGQLLFTDDAISEGVGPASLLLLKFGLFFFDYDLDGRLDLLTANGHLEEEISQIQESQQYAQPAQLFWNTGGEGGPTFLPVTAELAGPDLFKPIVGRGSAFADIDGDGDLDVVLTQVGGAPLLLRNELGSEKRWLRVKLIGTQVNRDAIGARVRLHSGDQVLERQVMPTRSYLSQSELPVTFGLGASGQIDRLEVIWPGGTVQEVKPPELNRLTVIQQSPSTAQASARAERGGAPLAADSTGR